MPHPACLEPQLLPETPSLEDRSGAAPREFAKTLYLALLVLIIAAGAFIRFYPTAAFQKRGFDEVIYQRYVSYLDTISVFNYPAISQQYLEVQTKETAALLPPTRFSFIYSAHLWRTLTGEGVRESLVHVSALFSTLTLVLAAGFCHRLGGRALALGVTALMAVSMNQIHQAQHAMIDGFFTFWCLAVLWSLWECLRTPGRPRLLAALGASIAVLVMTKENAFFVFVAVCAILATNRWTRLGTVTRPLVLVTFGSATLGFAVLLALAGGLDVFVAMYRLLVAKSAVLPYAIMTGDGPWYRYLVDLMAVSPLIMLLAAGAAFQVRQSDKTLVYLLLFLGCSFAVMASVKYGTNIRYATIWDLPLRVLAFTQLTLLARRWPARANVLLGAATVLLCAFELRQYFVFCVQWPSYALVPDDIYRALKIIK